MQVNNKNRNENIQGDKSQTKPDQIIESSEDSNRKKPSLNQKEKKISLLSRGQSSRILKRCHQNQENRR